MRAAPALVLLALGAAACGGGTGIAKVGGTCNLNRDCPANSACVSGMCKPIGATVCRNDQSCGAGKFCDMADGQCKNVIGSGPFDAARPAIDGGNDAGETPPPEDAATPVSFDASSPTFDSGTIAPDAAAPHPDASGVQDAAPPGMDAAAPAMDAAPAPMDATASRDATPPNPDAAPTFPDASPPDSGPADSGPTGCNAPAAPPCPSGMVCNPSSGQCAPGMLPLGSTCTFDQQCTNGICLGLSIGTNNFTVCTDGCGRGGDCPLHFSCTNVSGMSFCLGEALFGPPNPSFSTPAGGMCTMTSNTCQSGWCNTSQNQCLETCSRPADCGGANCYTYTQTSMMGTTTVTTYDHLCFSPASGFGDGSICLSNSDCLSGVCDRYQSSCVHQCCSEADCAASESCLVYDLDSTTPLKICAPRPSNAGTGALGATCTQGTDCQSLLCAPTDPTVMTSPRKCSTSCCTDQDCQALPAGGVCRPFGGPIMNTLLGVCVPR